MPDGVEKKHREWPGAPPRAARRGDRATLAFIDMADSSGASVLGGAINLGSARTGADLGAFERKGPGDRPPSHFNFIKFADGTKTPRPYRDLSPVRAHPKGPSRVNDPILQG